MSAPLGDIFRALLQQMPGAIVGTDANDVVGYVNEAFLRQFGLDQPAQHLIGGDCFDLLDELAAQFADPAEFINVVRALRAGGQSASGPTLLLADGRAVSLDHACMTSPLGEHRFWMVHDITSQEKVRGALARSNQLLARVGAAFSHYVSGGDSRQLFDGLLADALALTESEYGFIGRVLISPDGAPYLKTYALTNISWNEETRELYERHHRQGMEFHNLDTLFGRVLTSREPVISNTPGTDPRRGGLPEGHPPLNAFLGIPLVAGNRMVGMLGVANRSGGYDREMLDFLNPFLGACGNIIEAERNDHLRQESEHRLQELYQNLNDVFALSPDGFVSVDRDDRVLMVSPGFTKLTGIPATEVEGLTLNVLDRRFADLIEAGQKVDGLCRLLETPAPVTGEADQLVDTVTLRVPRLRVLQRFVRRSESLDSQTKALVCLRDITAESEVERMKNEFLSTAAHELRTPMASVYGFSELLLMREYDAESSREFLATIHAQSGRLVQMLNELLDLARIEARAGKDFVMEPGSVRTLLETVEREFSLQTSGHRLTIDIQTDLPDVHMDVDKIMQVFGNVIGNAIKYSPGGGSICIHAGCRRDSSEECWVEVSITDQGIGMTAAQSERIFERFYRADASGSVPGSGLGMSLVKEIVEIHGGRVEIDSSPGRGTRVTILLPAVCGAAVAEVADAEQEG